MSGQNQKVVIIGAGPAGLTAAYELMQNGVSSVTLEKDSVVGGISRTVNIRGYRFDIGGHRFFTKVQEVENLWNEVMGSAFIKVPRLSRIYYRDRFFDYPLRPVNALTNLGIVESALCVLSYFLSQIFPSQPETHFQNWVSNRFGRRLFNIFFKTYTEKVWGIPCDQIQAEWAAQRIKGLSLSKAILHAFCRSSSRETSLIDQFRYPELGPGQMWEAFEEKLNKHGSPVLLGQTVSSWHHDGQRITHVESQSSQGTQLHQGSHFLSSAPLQELILRLKPLAPQEVRTAAERLKYRDFLVVALMINAPKLFPDNWIYIHSPSVKVGRIQNFKNWSAKMVPDVSKSCVGMEYFCQQNDELWNSDDASLISQATREITHLKLIPNSNLVFDGHVVRMEKAYPVYDANYHSSMKVLRDYLKIFSNLQTMGRNGMHRYNNQDHSMLTALLSAKNIHSHTQHDTWSVNTEEEYHETAKVR